MNKHKKYFKINSPYFTPDLQDLKLRYLVKVFVKLVFSVTQHIFLNWNFKMIIKKGESLDQDIF